jgi:hypothetical protein
MVDPNRISSEMLLTPKETAALLRLHPTTLAIARSRGTLALPWVRIGRAIRYRRQDVVDWLQLNRHEPAARS